jgi:hypothetical protein
MQDKLSSLIVRSIVLLVTEVDDIGLLLDGTAAWARAAGICSTDLL